MNHSNFIQTIPEWSKINEHLAFYESDIFNAKNGWLQTENALFKKIYNLQLAIKSISHGGKKTNKRYAKLYYKTLKTL